MVDRIREILHARQLSPTQFADAIGVARPIVSHILSGRNKPSLEVVQKISEAFPDLSLSWLMKGIGDMQAPKAAATPIPSPAPPSARRSMAVKASETLPVAHSQDEAVDSKTETDIRASRRNSEGAEASVGTNANQVEGMSGVYGGLFPGPLRAQPSFEPTANTTPSNPAYVSTRQQEPNPSANTDAQPSVSASRPDAVTPIAPKAPVVAPIQVAPTFPPQAQAFIESGKAIRRIVIFYQDGTFTDYQPEAK